MKHLMTLSAVASIFMTSGAAAQLQLSIGSNSVATVEVDGRSLSVFPDIQNYQSENAKKPAAWRFYVAPIATPGFTSDGSVRYEQREFGQTPPIAVVGGYRVTFTTRIMVPLVLRTKTQIDRATAVLNERLGKESEFSFTTAQVQPMPVLSLAVQTQDLNGSGCSLLNPTIHVGAVAAPDEVFLNFECKDDIKSASARPPTSPKLERIDWLIKTLPAINAAIELTFEAKGVQIAIAGVQVTELRKTKLFAKTSGDGSEVFVSRDDLRNLTDDIVRTTELRTQGRRLSDDEARQCMLDRITSLPMRSVEMAEFSAEMLKRTYNGQDLSPNQLTKTLDERLDKSSTERNVKVRAKGEGSAFFGLFEGGAEVDGEEFKKEMSERGVKVAFEGNKWVAKGLNLVHVNASEFSQRVSRACSFATYGNEQTWANVKQPLVFRKKS